jgi:hypothetical protein
MPRAKKPQPTVEGYLPIGLKATRLQQMCEGTPYKADRILIFFKYLINGTRRYQKKGRIDPDLFVQMHFTHLWKIFGEKSAVGYKDHMIEAGLIETKNPFQYGNISTKYRICDHWFIPQEFGKMNTSPLYTRVKTSDKWTVIANAAYKEFKAEEMVKRLAQPWKALTDILKTVRLDTSCSEFESVMSAVRRNVKYQRIDKFDEVVESIISGENEYYIVCKFGRRFHTVWSSLKKELRSLVYFQEIPKERVKGLDIVNSQPWLTSIISEPQILNYVPEVAEELTAILKKATLGTDYWEYRTLCVEGGIYEHWIEVLRRELGDNWRQDMVELDKNFARKNKRTGLKKISSISDPALTDRQVAKLLFFRVIFAKQENEIGKNGRRRKLLENLKVLNDAYKLEWPSVWGLFADIKRNKFKCNSSKKNGGYTNLAMIMQRVESAIMGQIITAFFEEGINYIIPIYDGTLHIESEIKQAVLIANKIVAETGLPKPVIKEDE